MPTPACPLARFVLFMLLCALAGPLAAAEPTAAELPLEKVVLFTSGVGFFQSRRQGDRRRQREMSFKAATINDLLKSMVVEDLGGGTVSAVSYASRDPITKTLETFAIDLTDDPSVGQLLGRLRGERIEIEAAARDERHDRGRREAAGACRRRRSRSRRSSSRYSRPRACGRCPRLRSPESGWSTRGSSRNSNRPWRCSPSATTTRRSRSRSPLPARASGAVRVGYVQETPVWKTSYRLVLDDGMPTTGRGKALLQGWAIVENTTDRDWNDVRTVARERPADLVRDGPLPAAVRAASGRAAGTLRLARAAGLRAGHGRPGGRVRGGRWHGRGAAGRRAGARRQGPAAPAPAAAPAEMRRQHGEATPKLTVDLGRRRERRGGRVSRRAVPLRDRRSRVDRPAAFGDAADRGRGGRGRAGSPSTTRPCSPSIRWPGCGWSTRRSST